MTDPIVLEARIEQAATAERLMSQNGDTYLSVDFLDGIERAARIAVSMLTPRTITTAEELDKIPQGGVIRDAEGLILERHEYANDNPPTWWATRAGSGYKTDFGFSSNEVELPVAVLYVPEEQS